MGSLELEGANTLSPERELAHREQDGLDVTLLWDEVTGALKVVVFDERDETDFEIPAKPDQALDVFNHPFAYANLGPVALGTQLEAA